MKKIAADINYRMFKRASGIKVVYNASYGGFGLSAEGAAYYNELAGDENAWPPRNVVRHDPILVRVVEELEDDASGDYSDLQVAEIPGNKYNIREYDGYESIDTPESMLWIEVE
jgi:hypothetical protein